MDMVAKLDKLYPHLRKGKRCHFCGKPAEHIHHIISRQVLLLRFDLKNLLPLCSDCHRLIHDKGFSVENYISPSRWLYLEQMKNIQFQDYLIAHNLTRDEFFREQEQLLKEQING